MPPRSGGQRVCIKATLFEMLGGIAGFHLQSGRSSYRANPCTTWYDPIDEGLSGKMARRELEEYFDDDRSHQTTADRDARAD